MIIMKTTYCTRVIIHESVDLTPIRKTKVTRATSEINIAKLSREELLALKQFLSDNY